MKKILIVMTLLMSIMNARNYDIDNVPCFKEECVKQSKEYEEKHVKKETKEKHVKKETKEINSKSSYYNWHDGTRIVGVYSRFVGDSCIEIVNYYNNGDITYRIICM